jgi:hypothetical protein
VQHPRTCTLDALHKLFSSFLPLPPSLPDPAQAYKLLGWMVEPCTQGEHGKKGLPRLTAVLRLLVHMLVIQRTLPSDVTKTETIKLPPPPKMPDEFIQKEVPKVGHATKLLHALGIILIGM